MEPMNDIVSFLPKLTKLAEIIMLPATFIVILLNTTGNVKHKKKLNGIEERASESDKNKSEVEKLAGWINLMFTGACIGFAISLILMIFMQ